MARLFGLAGVLFAGSGVALGAFGAHALAGVLSERRLDTWNTAVDYQLIHALALLIVFLLWSRSKVSGAFAGKRAAVGLAVAGWGFLVGIILFSGSLYALSLGASAFFGPVTPIGGVSFMIGWTGLGFAIWFFSDAVAAEGCMADD
jgi:uncharacterized membrane protein YgdD (TMEM256/DUF423 family)